MLFLGSKLLIKLCSIYPWIKRRKTKLFHYQMTFIFVSVFLLSSNLLSAKDIQWQQETKQGSIHLRRIKGDALAVRQRLHSQNSKPELHTEISHLTSGCALELTWSLPAKLNDDHLSSSLKLSSIQKGQRQLAKKIAKDLWPAQSDQTRTSRFTLQLPPSTKLKKASWYGCGWSSKKEQVKSEPDSNIKPTLPYGAKSTPAQGINSLLGQEKLVEAELKMKRVGKRTILSSEQWTFAVVIDHKTKQKKNVNQDKITISKVQVHILHTAKDLQPLNDELDRKYKIESVFKSARVLLDFLSYREGIIDGLGKQATSKSWAGLLFLSLVSDEELGTLSSEWCEALLLGAIKTLPAWPHIFKAYARPMKPMDGRLLLPIALEKYLLKHPQGKKHIASFLQKKVKGIAISSVIKRHFQDLIGRSAFFANRPAQMYLIGTDDKEIDKKQKDPLKYSYTESVALMPRALGALSRLLHNEKVKAAIGVAVGLELRADKIQVPWQEKPRSFFGRELEVYEARARIENWGKFLKLSDPETPSLSIKKHLKYYNSHLNSPLPAIDAYLGLDLLWGQHEQAELMILLNAVRQFPAGLVTVYGLLNKHSLPFIDQLTPPSSNLLYPTMGRAALWILALNRQIKRKWPYKIIIRLEDARAALWQGLSGEGTSLSFSRHDAWLNPQLSVFDSLVLFTKAPPPIEAKQNVNARELH